MTSPKQLDLFDSRRPSRRAKEKRAPHNGTATSKAAAEAIEAKAPSIAACILAFVTDRKQFGATRNEISVELKIKIQTVCPRVNEMLNDGSLVDAGTRIEEGHRQQVLAIPPFAPPATE